jgi:hypothetical protein
MIEKEFTPTIPMFYKASREIFHSNKSSYLLYAFFLGIPALLMVYYLITGKGASYEVIPGISAWMLMLICVIYVFVLIPALQYWGVRKNVLSNPSANQSQNYTIDEAGVRNHGFGVEVSLSWDKIIRIKVTKNFVLLFISKNIAYFLPRELITLSEIDEIKKWFNHKTL